MDINKFSNVIFEGIDHGDCPDYCDAYIARAYYNKIELTQAELSAIPHDVFYELLEIELY